VEDEIEEIASAKVKYTSKEGKRNIEHWKKPLCHGEGSIL
jgi:hypothetical protein